MSLIISIFSLFVAIFAPVLTYIQIRNQIRPNIKIKSVCHDESSDIIEIEFSRLPQCYQLVSMQVVCSHKCMILDYGIGEFSQRIPTQLIPANKVLLNYVVNADFSSNPTSIFMWIRVEKSDHRHLLRFSFSNVLPPYFAGCEIPIIRRNDILI